MRSSTIDIVTPAYYISCYSEFVTQTYKVLGHEDVSVHGRSAAEMADGRWNALDRALKPESNDVYDNTT